MDWDAARSLEKLPPKILTSSDRQILLSLLREANHNGVIHGPSVETLAKASFVDTRTFQRRQRRLEEMGFFRTTRDSLRRGGRSKVNCYELSLPFPGTVPSPTRPHANPTNLCVTEIWPERTQALARAAAQAVGYPLDQFKPSDFAAANFWLASGASDEMVLHVIRADQARNPLFPVSA